MTTTQAKMVLLRILAKPDVIMRNAKDQQRAVRVHLQLHKCGIRLLLHPPQFLHPPTVLMRNDGFVMCARFFHLQISTKPVAMKSNAESQETALIVHQRQHKQGEHCGGNLRKG